MNIPHQSVIKSIERELGKAKSAEKSQQIREHIHSIKVLCEVLLEENNGGGTFTAPVQTQQMVPFTPQQQQSVERPVSVQKEEPLETDDGANGDSLFDF
ncbi:YwdI family protein [Rossellomorea aquimaris]|uniref:YwdI family protein n=1 Tax=Rossellomorea aquimaris TaxID=189382 RepID=UPI001CD6D6BC|nr:YwdI family protein [Rossellomorea aquimaris]MCA1055044.1 YwdI family protein [Rossellomorea aquimaris]